VQNPFLIGDNIYLRAIEMEDAPRFVEWLNDPEVRCYLARNFPPLNLGREREWIENLYKDQNSVTFAIVLKESDKLIGSTGLGDIDWRNRHAAFGIAIGDKTEWSKGHGTEATKLMVRYGFETLNLNRIFLTVFDHNPRAMRVYEKAGFLKEGVLRQDRYVNGAYRDTIVMGILREGWKE